MNILNEAIYAIYEASLDPDKWPHALSLIGNIFNAEGSIVIFYNKEVRAEFIYSSGLKDAVQTYLSEEWWRNDLHALRAIDLHVRNGDVIDDFTIATQFEMESHPIYVEFFKKVGFGWLMSAIMLPDIDSFVALSVPRAKWKGAFTLEEMETLRMLGRHVEQSLRISLRISNLEASQLALLSSLDAVNARIYALTDQGHLVLASKLGHESFDNYFCTISGRMVPRSAAERERFKMVVAAADDALHSGLTPQPCIITGQDARRLVVWALPITETSQRRIGAGNDVRTLVLAVPLERDQVVDPAVVRDIFGLSLGEARLAALIGSGLALQEAADHLGITQGSARVVLKRIFAKLGVNRQAELVLQLSALRN